MRADEFVVSALEKANAEIDKLKKENRDLKSKIKSLSDEPDNTPDITTFSVASKIEELYHMNYITSYNIKTEYKNIKTDEERFQYINYLKYLLEDDNNILNCNRNFANYSLLYARKEYSQCCLSYGNYNVYVIIENTYGEPFIEFSMFKKGSFKDINGMRYTNYAAAIEDAIKSIKCILEEFIKEIENK